jgi:hypothetical protein
MAEPEHATRPSRPDAPPPLRALDVDGLGVLLVGTLVFAVLSGVALLDQRRLAAEGHGWWLGVTVTGVVLGLLALGYAARRRRHTGH